MRLNKERGFTLVEMVLIVPIALLTIAGLVAFLITLYIGVLKDTALSRLAYEAQSTLFSIKDDAYAAYAFEEVPNAEVNDTHAPVGGWRYNASPFPLILGEVALNRPNELVDTRIVYHTEPNGCHAGVLQNEPVMNSLVYFIDTNKNLRRRVLVPDPVKKYCKTPYRQQTCPLPWDLRSEEQENKTFKTVPCPEDNILATGVVSLNKTYYNALGDPIVLSNGGSPLEAEMVKLELTLQKIISGDPVNYTASISISKNNGGDGVPDDPADL